jgi:acyl-CoA synthetase (NDP forming)
VSTWRAQLERAFNARVVAVVGDKQMNGFIWLRALQQFAGKVYSVQIDPNEIRLIETMGVTNLRSLLEIPEAVDYVVLAVPRAVAPRVLQDCVRKQVGAVTLFTSGFSETRDPEGIRLEQEIVDIARSANLPLIGPNCMGLANPYIGLCNFPGMLVGPAAAGPLGFIGQSGTHTITVCLCGPAEGMGISKAVSFGNGMIAEAADYIEYLRDDPETLVIGAYIEGVRNGRRLYDVLRSTSPTKPVILWKGGVTEAGNRAIFSHTAALATPSAVWCGMARQAGAISVDSEEALLDVARTLVAGKTAAGLCAGLIAMTGGPSVAITDAFTQAGLEVPLLSDASYAALRPFFQTVGGGLGNPLDAGATIAMGFRSDNLERLFAVVSGDPRIDLIVLDLGGALAVDRWLEYPGPAQAMFDVVGAFAQRSAKPFAVVFDAPHRPQEAVRFRDELRQRGVLTFVTAERAAHALRRALEYWRFRAELE